jgi:glutamate synthase (NADPH/NADH) small chain
MGDITGFLKVKRKEAGNRPVNERICDYSEVEQILNSEDRMLQASRCMDCGIPFCHWSCPVDNLIPEWNELLYRGDWKGAYDRLYATNNFPEFTGRICPASCEHACVLNIEKEPVTIRENEVAIAEKAFAEGYIKPSPPAKRSGKTVAVIGSGPAGLAAADILNKAGHRVTVFEKDEKPGGLLRFGIPDFKLRKVLIDRRVNLMISEGLEVQTGINVGRDITLAELTNKYDAVCIAIGAGEPRDLNIEGRQLQGIHFAMDFLSQQNRINAGLLKKTENLITAENKKVVVIGGGDTGSDCVGTAIRQKAASVTQIEILPRPPLSRTADNPWPYFAKTLKTSTSHEEGCSRFWSLSTTRFLGNEGRITGIEVMNVNPEISDGKTVFKPLPDTSKIIDADLVLLALGFKHPVIEGLITNSGIELDNRMNIKAGTDYSTSMGKVFAAGDAVSGASLVVNAIASGRKAAKAIISFLSSEQ